MPLQEFYAPENHKAVEDNGSRRRQLRTADPSNHATVAPRGTLQEYYAPNLPGSSTGFHGPAFDTGIDVESFDTLFGCSGPVVSVAFSPDGTQIAVGSKDASVRIYNTIKPKSRRDLLAHSAIVEVVVFSGSGLSLASGSGDQTICVWEAVGSRRLRKKLTGHTAAVRAAVFSRDERTIVSGAEDGTVRVWDLKSGSHQVVSGQKPLLAAVAFSRDAGLVALSSHGGSNATLKLLDLNDPGLRFLPGADVISHGMAFAPDGKVLVAGMADNTVRSWNFAMDSSRVLVGHQAPVFAVACSPDGSLVASGSADGTVRIWNSGENSDHLVISNEAKVWALAYSPDGKTIAAGLGNGNVRILGSVFGSSKAGTIVPKRSIWKVFQQNRNMTPVQH